jgi:hypothetical protein
VDGVNTIKSRQQAMAEADSVSSRISSLATLGASSSKILAKTDKPREEADLLSRLLKAFQFWPTLPGKLFQVE